MNITFLVSESTPHVCTTHLVFFFQQKKWLRPFTTEMKKQIVKGYWLTDEHMHFAQELLKEQFPQIEGWQSTLLAQNNGFIPIKMDAIQIHVVSESHWVTSSRLGGTVTLYDSRRVGRILSSTLTHQLCQVYRTSICESGDKRFLAVNVATVQRQHGSDDCGLFAIAFALHAALGQCLEETEFVQVDMRNHLLKCFTARKFTPFSTSIVRRECNPRIIQLNVFCCCQMPATYGDMVQCGRCEQWFHIKCVGLPSLPSSDEEWNCSLCA